MLAVICTVGTRLNIYASGLKNNADANRMLSTAFEHKYTDARIVTEKSLETHPTLSRTMELLKQRKSA